MTPYVRERDTVLGQSPIRNKPSWKWLVVRCSAFFWYLIIHQRFCRPVCHFVSLMLTLLTCGSPPPQSTAVTQHGFCVSSSKCLIGYARLYCQASQLSAETYMSSLGCALDPEAMLTLLSVSRVHFNTAIVLS